ncbi:hypothetical protein B0A48_05385 [Cryoendolithus antarcticus]|uniref:Uncharacterized protein n=1 Tax=Cryoendolithus antarcticus TaxID=1507870 RepID=A0A1V8TID6_9PEZI|nr:hypothetical protein B0A48_05385 [Cryoendolithus antarcticus]
MADSTTDNTAADIDTCMSEGSATTAVQPCDPQMPVPGQRTLLLDLPLELLQDIVERTDMLMTMHLVCKTLEAATLDLFADEHLDPLGCFIYNEQRWLRIRAWTTSRLSHKIKYIELSNDVLEVSAADGIPTVSEQQHAGAWPSSHPGQWHRTELLNVNLRQSDNRLPSSALMTAVLRSVKCLANPVSVELRLTEVLEITNLDLKSFPVHRELLFAIAVSGVPVHSLCYTLYSMHHLEDIVKDFGQDLIPTLATVNEVSFTTAFSARQVDPQEGHASRVECAVFLLKASGVVRELYLDFHHMEPVGGEMMRMLLANDFVCLEDLSCYDGHFAIEDLLVALTRAHKLQKLELYDMRLDGLRAGWQELLSSLQAIPLLRSLQLGCLHDNDATMYFHDAVTGAHVDDVDLSSRTDVERWLTLMAEEGVCFGKSQVHCIGARKAYMNMRANA